ncbi:MAG: phosphate ABC transporter permease PstA [Phototrophicaceae bacterium]
MTSLLNITQDQYKQKLQARQTQGVLYTYLYRSSLVVAVLSLIVLALTVLNQNFGLVVVQYKIDPTTLSDEPLENLDKNQLGEILQQNAPRRILVLVRDTLAAVAPDQFTTLNLDQALGNVVFPEGINPSEQKITDLSDDQVLALLVENSTPSEMLTFVNTEVVGVDILKTYSFYESASNRAAIDAETTEKFPEATIEFRSWLSGRFLQNGQSANVNDIGVRTALIGSLWIMLVTILTALPLGVGAAIYLEEYATANAVNRLIETNIRNLAGVPSIIYGILGLSIFVRALVFITSGSAFSGLGVEANANGRTILSAGMSLALLILPIIIINGQEAIRAVPRTIREASYGLGATKWQTISRQVLPAAIPGILTGTILAFSRAIGETAPLIVVGASTVLTSDPNNVFSPFTVIPIQIYNWTSRPQPEYQHIAAAAIIVLLILLLVLNTFAIILRNRYSKNLS